MENQKKYVKNAKKERKPKKKNQKTAKGIKEIKKIILNEIKRRGRGKKEIINNNPISINKLVEIILGHVIKGQIIKNSKEMGQGAIRQPPYIVPSNNNECSIIFRRNSKTN